jgi:hypothetical protein
MFWAIKIKVGDNNFDYVGYFYLSERVPVPKDIQFTIFYRFFTSKNYSFWLQFGGIDTKSKMSQQNVFHTIHI